MKVGHRLYLVDLPGPFRRELESALPPDCSVVTGPEGTKAPFDVVLVWLSGGPESVAVLPALSQMLKPDGALWAAVPKKRSGLPGPTFQQVQEVLLPLGLVDNKDLGLTESWYGTRFVWRRELRPGLQGASRATARLPQAGPERRD
ncbi:MAG: hypothetical protein HY683_06060 [Chloroflexi bacterium]|nr:hypothetical protein [Chloroflexota bacterium]